MAVTKMFSSSRPDKNATFCSMLVPISANWLAFTIIITAGSKSGMLKIAMSVALLLVFTAMAETTVSMPEKLAEPSKITAKKWK